MLLAAAIAFELGIGNDIVDADIGPQIGWDEAGLQRREVVTAAIAIRQVGGAGVERWVGGSF